MTAGDNDAKSGTLRRKGAATLRVLAALLSYPDSGLRGTWRR